MDILCQAKSGMGKTAVFVLATLQQIEPVDGQVMRGTRSFGSNCLIEGLRPGHVSHQGAGFPDQQGVREILQVSGQHQSRSVLRRHGHRQGWADSEEQLPSRCGWNSRQDPRSRQTVWMINSGILFILNWEFINFYVDFSTGQDWVLVLTYRQFILNVGVILLPGLHPFHLSGQATDFLQELLQSLVHPLKAADLLRHGLNPLLQLGDQPAKYNIWIERLVSLGQFTLFNWWLWPPCNHAYLLIILLKLT